MTVCDNYWAICNHCVCGGFSFEENKFVYLIERFNIEKIILLWKKKTNLDAKYLLLYLYILFVQNNRFSHYLKTFICWTVWKFTLAEYEHLKFAKINTNITN